MSGSDGAWRRLSWTHVVGFLGLVAAVVGVRLFLYVGVSLQELTNLANMLSGIGSIVLVLITFEYTRQTRYMVEVQREAARRTENERWYRETLTHARLAESRWQDIYRKSSNTEFIRLDEHPEMRETLQQKMDDFERQWSGRPPVVSDEMAALGDDVFRRWRRLRRVDEPIIDPTREERDIRSLVRALRQQLEDELESERADLKV